MERVQELGVSVGRPMPSSHYRFVTHWYVPGTPEDVYDLIDHPIDFPRWWPAVWLRVEVLDPGDPNGIGKVVRYLSKGWLPYLLQWTGRVVEKEYPRRLVLHASGDFVGEGHWSFHADGPNVAIEYIWTIEANKPLLRYLSLVLRPIFAANHRWAMARGEESLRLELARRRARNDEERSRIPAPPQPTFLGARRRRRLGLVPLTGEPGHFTPNSRLRSVAEDKDRPPNAREHDVPR